MALRKTFTFNGENSSYYGLYISGAKVFNTTRRSYTKVPVPSRNGDFIQSDNRYENQVYQYEAFLFGDVERKTDDIASWLLSAKGYCRLEDDYHPDFYRKAFFGENMEYELTDLIGGTGVITFDCKPGKWLKSGEHIVTITEANSHIFNPTKFDAEPIIRIYGKGSVTINGYTVTLDRKGSVYAEVDCEAKQVIENTGAFMNDSVTITNWKFPVLSPGKNTIILGSGVTKVEVIPNWWTV